VKEILRTAQNGDKRITLDLKSLRAPFIPEVPTKINESFWRISRNENDMGDSNRTFAKIIELQRSGQKTIGSHTLTQVPVIKDSYRTTYKPSVPEYMRIDEFYLDRKNIKHPERIAVVDKMNGWVTVDSTSLDRKGAFEKKKTNIDNRKTSSTSPEWMQTANKL
jgi:hypothetical protein